MIDELTAAIEAIKETPMPAGVRCVIFVARALEDEEGYQSAFTHNCASDQLAVSIVVHHIHRFLDDEGVP